MGSASFSSPNLAQNKPTNQRSESQYSQKKRKAFSLFYSLQKELLEPSRPGSFLIFPEVFEVQRRGEVLLYFYCDFIVFLLYFYRISGPTDLYPGFLKVFPRKWSRVLAKFLPPPASPQPAGDFYFFPPLNF